MERLDTKGRDERHTLERVADIRSSDGSAHPVYEEGRRQACELARVARERSATREEAQRGAA